MAENNIPEFFPDQESKRRARFAAEKVLSWLSYIAESGGDSHRQRDRPQDLLGEFIGDVPAADVETDVTHFGDLVALAAASDRRIPVVPLNKETNIPILRPFPDGESWEYLRYARLVPFALLSELTDYQSSVTLAPLDSAIGYFVTGLEKFLAHRLAGFGYWQRLNSWVNGGTSNSPPPASSLPALGPLGSLAVTLHAQNPGVRAHASPAYGISWRFFGHPTNPATGLTGYLRSGHWIFAGDGATVGAWVEDHTIFQIPYDYAPVVLAF